MSTIASIDPELVISHKFRETIFYYTESDVAQYALGVGACGNDRDDEGELGYVYHQNGQQFIKVLPTFGAIFVYRNRDKFSDISGLKFDPNLLLHGQQYMELYKPLPSRCCIVNKQVVAGLHDKGKATILEIETTSYDKVSGEALCMNRNTIFLRGVGGFSKPGQLFSYTNYPRDQVSPIIIPKCEPSSICEDVTQKSQALLYRLSGDYNPIHSDPKISSIAGFDRPILHGLCTYGFAVRAIIKYFCLGDISSVKTIFGRFLLHVFPGETLITEMWLVGSRVIFQTKVKERDQAVLSGYVCLHRSINSSL
ncbi:Enoyl-CoA hydratase [Zostera marina]|uniref:Enoyl-CoA hydratase n=1 Tax=Zostera marina TaxID=29655 RepID=A0A0K9NUB3_ZOSMR|nr:Enoyl-CoA hydratase [Zostera marina]